MNNNYYLLFQLTRKDIEARYKGSVLGVLWSFLTPLLMLTVYTFVFSEIFQAKWNVNTDNKFAFALTLFCALNLMNMVNDVLNRSTGLIAGNTSYVKKVIFPLDLLPITITLSNLFNCLIGYFILILARLLLERTISATVWLLPLVLVPFVLLVLGMGYFISSVSVYLKDMGSIMTIVTMLLMYLSPVFFPLESVPSTFAVICKLNPLTFIIENTRNVALYGLAPNWKYYLISVGESTAVLYVGHQIFNRLKEGFSDVL